MKNPVVTYRVSGYFGDQVGDEETQWFGIECEAIEAASSMHAGRAKEVVVERFTLRVVEEREPVDWRKEVN